MLKLTIKSQKGTYDVSQLVTAVTWSGDYLQCARTLEFGIVASPSDKTIPTVNCELGSLVTLTVDGAKLFEGYIFNRQKNTNSSIIDIGCFDRGIYLKRSKSSEKYLGKTPEQIASELCAKFGIAVGSLAAAGVPVTRNFPGATLYDIIQTSYTIASEANGKKYMIRFSSEKLDVIEKGANGKSVMIQGGSNLIDASTSESVENMVNQVAIYDSNDTLLRVVKKDDEIQLYGLMQEYVKQTKEDVSAKAQAMLTGPQQKITVNALGNVQCVTGNSVIVQEPYTGLYGLFYIDSDVHTWKNGIHFCKLVLNYQNMMDAKQAGAAVSSGGSGSTGTSGEWNYVNPSGGA